MSIRIIQTIRTHRNGTLRLTQRTNEVLPALEGRLESCLPLRRSSARSPCVPSACSLRIPSCSRLVCSESARSVCVRECATTVHMHRRLGRDARRHMRARTYVGSWRASDVHARHAARCGCGEWTRASERGVLRGYLRRLASVRAARTSAAVWRQTHTRSYFTLRRALTARTARQLWGGTVSTATTASADDVLTPNRAVWRHPTKAPATARHTPLNVTETAA